MFWISPLNDIPNVATLVRLARAAQLPGYEIHVALPTAYGMDFQGTISHQFRAIGDELAPTGVADCARIRAAIEATGIACDGWCVPRGDRDPAKEGYLHGQIAAQFNRFYLNLEAGWNGFWTCPTDLAATKAYLSGFSQALGDSGRLQALTGNVGCTWVVDVQANGGFGAMPNAFSAECLRAWLAGTHFGCLETYGPGGAYKGYLDPDHDVPGWRAHLDQLGFKDYPLIAMLAPPNDLRAQMAAWGKPEVHFWTLLNAAPELT